MMKAIQLRDNYKIRMLGHNSIESECLRCEQENPEKTKFCMECVAKLK